MSETIDITKNWVWGSWVILPKDRNNTEPEEGQWTLVEPTHVHARSLSLTTGPLGRKARWPENFIEAEGYETEGISAEPQVREIIGHGVNIYLSMLRQKAK